MASKLPDCAGPTHGTIATAHGHWVTPLRGVGEIDLRDIAHALATLNRWTGHARIPISVAQHSILVSQLVAQWHPGNLEAQRWALMHDAAEYAIGDISRPVRQGLRAWDETRYEYQTITAAEMVLLRSIGWKFGLEWQPPWDLIQPADDQLLICERLQLFDDVPQEIRNWAQANPGEIVHIEEWDWRTAKTRFLARAAELGIVPGVPPLPPAVAPEPR